MRLKSFSNSIEWKVVLAGYFSILILSFIYGVVDGLFGFKFDFNYYFLIGFNISNLVVPIFKLLIAGFVVAALTSISQNRNAIALGVLIIVEIFLAELARARFSRFERFLETIESEYLRDPVWLNYLNAVLTIPALLLGVWIYSRFKGRNKGH